MASDPPIAAVAGRPIPVSRLEERLLRIRQGPRGRHVPPAGTEASMSFRRWVAQDLVTEAVLAHEAAAAGLHDDAGDVEPGAVACLVERVTADVTVPDTVVRAYYERNVDLYRRPEIRVARHGLTTHRPSAADPGERSQPVEFRRGVLSGPFEDAVFAAEVGAVVGPIQSELGWHVAVLVAVIPEHVVPYDEVADGIREQLLTGARARAFEAWLETRRADLAVIEPGFEHPAHPVHGPTGHRH